MKKILVGETYMSDGVDLIHTWGSVEEALVSGRFEYLNEMWDEDLNDLSWEEVQEIEDLEEFINTVGYPFYLVESESRNTLAFSIINQLVDRTQSEQKFL